MLFVTDQRAHGFPCAVDAALHVGRIKRRIERFFFYDRLKDKYPARHGYIEAQRLPLFFQPAVYRFGVAVQPFVQKTVFYALVHIALLFVIFVEHKNFGHLFEHAAVFDNFAVRTGNADNRNRFVLKTHGDIRSLQSTRIFGIGIHDDFVQVFIDNFLCRRMEGIEAGGIGRCNNDAVGIHHVYPAADNAAYFFDYNLRGF